MANTWTTLLDAVYPVGSVYISYSTTSPATRFGGTWSAITECFPRFASSDSSAGLTGGNDSITLSLNHNHAMHLNWGSGVVSASGGYSTEQCGLKYGEGDASIPYAPVLVSQSKNVLGSSATAIDPDKGATTLAKAAKPLDTVTFNNMPAYYQVYAWRRTA